MHPPMERGVVGGRPAASTVWLPLGDDCRLSVRAPGVIISADDSALSEGAGLSGRHP